MNPLMIDLRVWKKAKRRNLWEWRKSKLERLVLLHWWVQDS